MRERPLHGGEDRSAAPVVLDFSVNTNPLGMPPAVRQLLRDNVIGVFEAAADGGIAELIQVLVQLQAYEDGNGAWAQILFENISAVPIHATGDELRERFARGDASRRTEGSGLGLSIAGSLTELMGGTFDVQVDGDVFRAVLRFPECRE